MHIIWTVICHLLQPLDMSKERCIMHYDCWEKHNHNHKKSHKMTAGDNKTVINKISKAVEDRQSDGGGGGVDTTLVSSHESYTA